VVDTSGGSGSHREQAELLELFLARVSSWGWAQRRGAAHEPLVVLDEVGHLVDLEQFVECFAREGKIHPAELVITSQEPSQSSDVHRWSGRLVAFRQGSRESAAQVAALLDGESSSARVEELMALGVSHACVRDLDHSTGRVRVPGPGDLRAVSPRPTQAALSSTERVPVGARVDLVLDDSTRLEARLVRALRQRDVLELELETPYRVLEVVALERVRSWSRA
jgi:hypothetical protein